MDLLHATGFAMLLGALSWHNKELNVCTLACSYTHACKYFYVWLSACTGSWTWVLSLISHHLDLPFPSLPVNSNSKICPLPFTIHLLTWSIYNTVHIFNIECIYYLQYRMYTHSIAWSTVLIRGFFCPQSKHFTHSQSYLGQHHPSAPSWGVSDICNMVEFLHHIFQPIPWFPDT
jgi:hypothetical protein